jgi:hypothetical protein
MADKKASLPLRGSKLVKKALEAAKASILAAPEPIPSSLVRKLRLPNGEPLSAGMKELLAFDGEWLGIGYDEDEGEIEATSLEEVVEEHFGEEAVAAFGEAYDLLSEDCVLFGAELERPACLYVGTPDDLGEYPVLTLTWTDGVAKIGGFVPFDIWVAQELGGLERAKDIGDVPPAYAGVSQTLAESNADGRIAFTPKAGEEREEGEDEDEDEDKDEEDDDDDDDDESEEEEKDEKDG